MSFIHQQCFDVLSAMAALPPEQASGYILYEGHMLPSWSAPRCKHVVWIRGSKPESKSFSTVLGSVQAECSDHPSLQQLPFKDNTFSEVVRVLLPQAPQDLRAWGREAARVLQGAGQLSAVTLGTGSFHLMDADQVCTMPSLGKQAEAGLHMHDLADVLSAAGLRDVVVSAYEQVLRYRKQSTLQQDLQPLLAHGFVSCEQLQHYDDAVATWQAQHPNQALEVTLELIGIRAIGGMDDKQVRCGDVVHVPIGSIKRR